MVQVGLGKIRDLIFKITRTKRTGSVAQVENLLSMYETLSSNPSNNQKNK
jgi:hypothetical protein